MIQLRERPGGFTRVELLVVLGGLFGLLASLLVPQVDFFTPARRVAARTLIEQSLRLLEYQLPRATSPVAEEALAEVASFRLFLDENEDDLSLEELRAIRDQLQDLSMLSLEPTDENLETIRDGLGDLNAASTPASGNTQQVQNHRSRPVQWGTTKMIPRR